MKHSNKQLLVILRMNKVWTKEEAFIFRLKKGMKDNNMTITDLAQATGISTRGIRFWISEIRCCKESFLPRIADALGVSVYDMTQPPSDAELQELNNQTNENQTYHPDLKK